MAELTTDRLPLRIIATGYVSTQEGSVAGANAVLLRQLLSIGHRIAFHSKANFVDPRPAVQSAANRENFDFIDSTNAFPAVLARQMMKRSGSLPGRMIAAVEHAHYNRHLIKRMAMSNRQQSGDVTLWMGLYAAGCVDGVPAVSFAQGPPGTDARSIAQHRERIIQLAGKRVYSRLAWMAKLRQRTLSGMARHSDHVIVGSQWSKQQVQTRLGVSRDRVHALPYPIDLQLFCPLVSMKPTSGPLHVVWVGRFAPRKRLDLFLDGLALAIQQGVDVRATVVGKSAMVPGYEQLIESFGFPDRLTHHPFLPRTELPSLLATCDVLAQPSDDEDFGSSVAEAMACGVPAIVGATNGTADYICGNSIHLRSDSTEEYATSLATMLDWKRQGRLQDTSVSRDVAEGWFCPSKVTGRLIDVLHLAAGGSGRKSAV